MSRPGRGAPLLAPGVPARRHFRNGGPQWSSNNASRKTRNAERRRARGPFVLVACFARSIYWRDTGPLKALPCPGSGEAVMSDLLKWCPFATTRWTLLFNTLMHLVWADALPGQSV